MIRPLFIQEIREMQGQPVYCPSEGLYGIIRCDTTGEHAYEPYLTGIKYTGKKKTGIPFELNIIERNLECYPVYPHEQLLKDIDDSILRIQAQDGTVYENIEYYSRVINKIYVKVKGDPKKHLAATYKCDGRAERLFDEFCKQTGGLLTLPESTEEDYKDRDYWMEKV